VIACRVPEGIDAGSASTSLRNTKKGTNVNFRRRRRDLEGRIHDVEEFVHQVLTVSSEARDVPIVMDDCSRCMV